MMRSLTVILLAGLWVSTAAAQQYKLGTDSMEHADVPKGKITHHTLVSKVFPETFRDYWVYVPAQYNEKTPACVMVFQDGASYKDPKGPFRVPTVLDNLIHQKKIPLMAAVFINPGVIKDAKGKVVHQNRSFEYDTLSNQYATFLEKEILPAVGKSVNLRQDAAGRGIGGISSGGICAFTVAWERPDLFSKVLSHVGSFTNIRGGDRYPGIIRKTPKKDIRVFLQDGKNDLDNEHGNWWLGNLQMEAALKYKKYDFKFVPGEGKHDGNQGGAILPESLVWLWRDTSKAASDRSGSRGESVDALLKQIKAVGKEGKGNPETAKALKKLTAFGSAALLPTLAALDNANPVAANYLRAAADTIVDKTLAAGKKLPVNELDEFVQDTSHAGPARKLAFDFLLRVDKAAENRYFLTLLNDPAAELRRWAVKGALKDAKKSLELNPAKVNRKVYEKLLQFARDRDQVLEIVQQLKKLDADVDLVKHFGFVTQWEVVGPFDSTAGKGYHTAYPPEKKVDLSASYTGKDGKKVQWKKATATTKKGEVDVDELAVVDLTKAIGPLHGVAAYAFTVVEADKEMPVQIRAASANAVQIYLNGKQIYGREEYHHGMEMDQHIGKGLLKAGKNELLVKVCQNEQTEPHAQVWSFQVRITDALGAAAPVKIALNERT